MRLQKTEGIVLPGMAHPTTSEHHGAEGSVPFPRSVQKRAMDSSCPVSFFGWHTTVMQLAGQHYTHEMAAK